MTAFAFYLLKVMICSGVLFLYYYLALRNKLFHQWNRFYLLAAIIISLIAPVIQVTIMHSADKPDKAIQVLQVFESAGGYLEEVTISGRPSISTDQWLLMGYIIISGVFFLSVLLSFQKIISIVKSHTVQWIEKIGFITTKAKGTPFSFFNYIFWNEEIDLQTETGKQIFQHELVHVKEKHTIDKLFVQIVLMVFWCNPFFWLIRRELKLIHEFIADKRSVGEHGTAALAAMILNASYPTRFNSLTNQFFQTSIKRRIAMLAKIQNPRINYLSRILAFSILIVTVLAFTLRTKKLTVPSVKLAKTITVVIDAAHGLMENGKHSGAVVDNIAEDDIVLAIANKIKELNTNDQIKIVFTRPTEQIVDLHKRVDIARESNADLFLSIHINAVPTNSGSNSKKESSGFGIYVGNKQTAFQQESQILGSVLREELNGVYPTNSSLLKAGVWVLDQNVCPSVMVECGWLTTKKDREFITKEKNQEEVARKILEAIGRYASNQQSQKINPDVIKDTISSGNIKKGKIILESNSVMYIAKPRGTGFRQIFIINGQPVDPVTLYGKKIISKKAIIYEKDQAEAIAKYGNEAKNGVSIFEDARIEELTESEARKLYLDTIPKRQVTISEVTLDNSKPSDQDNVFRNKWDPLNPPIIILDGKEVPEKDLSKINADEIMSMTVLKGQTATGRYGEKARNGAIIITSKNNVQVKDVILSPLIDTVPKKGNVDPNQIFTKVEIAPSIDKTIWTDFLRKNLQSFIEKAASNGMPPGTYVVNVRFIVRTDGSISNVETLNDPGYDLTKNVLEMMKTSPKWNPALQNGRPVSAYHTQPITFVIQEQGNDEPKRVLPEVTLNDLKKWDRLNIPNLVSFDLVYVADNGNIVHQHNQTEKFGETTRNVLAKRKPGEIITFERILAEENGRQVKKSALGFTVTQ